MPSRPIKRREITKKHIARLERERRQTNLIRWIAISIVVIVLGLIGYGYLNENYLKKIQPVARVGEEEITTAQFQARVRLQRQQIIGQYAQYYQFSQMFGMDLSSQLQQFEFQLSASGAGQLGQGILDSMINEVLLRQEAEKLGITVSEEEIQERLQAAFDYYPNGEPTATVTPTEVTLPTISAEQAAIVTITPTPGPTETATQTETPTPTLTVTPDLTTTATATLEPTATVEPSATPTSTATEPPTQTATPAPTSTPLPTSTPVTKEGFEETFASSMESFSELGFSEADYRNLVKLDLLRAKMFDYVTRDIKPVEEQVWARHILVIDEETALDARRRLLRGDDFAVVASELSLDTSNKDQGGDLGWFGRGVMVTAFEEAAFSQKPGEIGNPVKTEFGWHVIQVIGHEDRPLTADQFEQAKQNAFNEWLSDLRAKAEEAGLIEIFDYWKERVPLDPDLASAFAQ